MTILMSRPTNFAVSYEINPWMSIQNKVLSPLASSQWEELKRAISDCADIKEVPANQHPDFVFTANAGLVHNREVILSSFSNSERRQEEPYWKSYFIKQEYTTHTLTNVSFEGAGDALFSSPNTLIGGYGFRSDKAAYDQIAEIWNIEIIPVELVDERFYHLDTCLCVLDEHTILYYKDAFSKKSQKTLKKRYTCIEVSEKEALHFACNAIVIENTIILPSGAPNVQKVLKSAGYEPKAVDMTEFMKSGGAAKCLTLAL